MPTAALMMTALVHAEVVKLNKRTVNQATIATRLSRAKSLGVKAQHLLPCSQNALLRNSQFQHSVPRQTDKCAAIAIITVWSTPTEEPYLVNCARYSWTGTGFSIKKCQKATM